GMYGKIARFHKAQRLKTLPLSDPRPEIPKNFRGSAPLIKKGTFLMTWAFACAEARFMSLLSSPQWAFL
ncbi:MAG: hypothetical protein IKJ65_00600, partial [Clostridia bacterium]|nr:hypothetical protein [Clostridia bacterium]